MSKTQEQIILKAIQDHPEGIHPTTLVTETAILQYNARINGLRSRFGCICKNGNSVCLASEHILNKRLPNGTTKFFYRRDEIETNDTFKAYVERGKQERNITSKVSLF